MVYAGPLLLNHHASFLFDIRMKAMTHVRGLDMELEGPGAPLVKEAGTTATSAVPLNQVVPEDG